jgi:hypothetical protein
VPLPTEATRPPTKHGGHGRQDILLALQVETERESSGTVSGLRRRPNLKGLMMNGYQLSRHDTNQPLKLWACGGCNRIYGQQDVADKCCLCLACGQPVSENPRNFYGTTDYPTHFECRHEQDRQRKIEHMDQAEKLDDHEGWVYCDGYGSNEGYFESLDDFLEWWEDEHGDEKPPEFVWTCKPQRIVPPADEILEGLLTYWLENGWDDMDESAFTGLDELRAAVGAFVSANEGVVSYTTDGRAVRVREADA